MNNSIESLLWLPRRGRRKPIRGCHPAEASSALCTFQDGSRTPRTRPAWLWATLGHGACARTWMSCSMSKMDVIFDLKNGIMDAIFGEILNFAIFWRARYRLYQNELLQEHMRLRAFFKLYEICILLHRCNRKILAKNRFEKSVISVKIQQKICKCRRICKILPNFKNFSWIIW